MSNVKFGKEQIQKIVLSTIMLIVSIAVFINYGLKPLNARAANARTQIIDLQKNIKEADLQTRRTNALKESAVQADETVTHFLETISEGAPIAWFPLRMTSFFNRQGIKEATTRQQSTIALQTTGLDGWTEIDWAIDIPSVGYPQAGIAIAALENEELLLEITELNITAAGPNPEFQTLKLTALLLLK